MEKISLDRMEGEKPKITRIAKSMPRIIIATQLYKCNAIQCNISAADRLFIKSKFHQVK